MAIKRGKNRSYKFNPIEDAGALLGQCVTMTNGKSMIEVNKYKPKTDFGIWLKQLVDKEMIKIRQELIA